MSSGLAAVAILAVAVVLAAAVFPQAIRVCAPLLMRAPRVAIATLVIVPVAWVGAVASVGLITASLLDSARTLPGQAGDWCARCVAAASPFADGAVASAIPPAVPLAGAIAVVVAAASGVVREMRSSRRRAIALGVRMGSSAVVTIDGIDVDVVDAPRALAFAVRHPRPRIVLSRKTLELLSAPEIAAVVAHERAHLRQRHHALNAAVMGVARAWGAVPLVKAAADAIPHYLEMAADDAAARRTSTPILAKALLVLADEAGDGAPNAAILHATGPSRMAHLVNAGGPVRGRGVAVTAGATTAALGAVGIATVSMYITAVIAGCT